MSSRERTNGTKCNNPPTASCIKRANGIDASQNEPETIQAPAALELVAMIRLELVAIVGIFHGMDMCDAEAAQLLYHVVRPLARWDGYMGGWMLVARDNDWQMRRPKTLNMA